LHHHQPGGASLGGALGELARLVGGGFRHGQQRRLALGRLLDGFQHIDALVMAQHRAFAERATGDEAVDARIDLQAVAALHLFEIKRPVLGELGGDRRDYALPHFRMSS